MVDKKVKSRSQSTLSGKKGREPQNNKRKKSGSRKNEASEKRARSGPRLPNAFLKEIGGFNSVEEGSSDGYDNIDVDGVGNDFYEYEEDLPEEETKKNKRFDPVVNYQYELPKDFEDENIASDEGEDDEDEDNHKGNEDDERHSRMLQEITGLPSDAFGGKQKKVTFVSEAYPESEYNPSRDILDGDGRISIEELLDPLHGKPGFSKLRKSLRRMESKAAPILAPLPKPEQERLERKAAYEQSKKDITKWEPLVKRNREAPTLYFDENVDLGFSTIGAIASEFEPRTDFEKKIASLVNHNDVVEAHKKDGARLLELNKISVEEVKNRQDQLAKMRSLLFRHEMKAKRIKKIKSKTYHRLMKKDRKKSAEAAVHFDPEAAKELAMKQEFKRAEERMTLKHKNSSKWAKRILERGLKAQDEGTREAFGEQLNQHAALTRKMNSVKESSSSDESSDDYDSDDTLASSDEDNKSKLLMKAKEKTLKLLEGDEELPKGVLTLPFMVRGLKKRKEAAQEEANAALEEFESSLKELEDKGVTGSREIGSLSGRKVFGVPKKAVIEKCKKVKSDNYFGNSDSESDVDLKEDEAFDHNGNNESLREADIDPNLLRDEFEINHDAVFKSFEDPEPKTSYEVSYLASDSWKKMKRSSNGIKQTEDSINNVSKSNVTVKPLKHDQDIEEEDDGDDSGTDSGGEMVDGILSFGAKPTYELPSQAELIQRAFAGDDVEEEFEKDKEAVLNEEYPVPEEPTLLPGWGQWTDIQKKRGLPSWMVKEHEIAKKEREEALKKRKDANLKHVIISEKLDKKAEKLHTKTLPYPFTSKEVYEQSIRMPIGPEFNPATAVGALNRPEVVKKAGLIIKPIKYEDMNSRERAQVHKHNGGGERQKKSKDKNRSMKKMATKV
ncbi:hypothetical protein ACJIZ3_003073 [Penstemon smallii]|uniref:Uncharacterized protein n=1 Tax=Penstemon smallii TaxID=265156 RepID=A0ABD3U9L6_9LAMI